jgi:kumamolisin
MHNRTLILSLCCIAYSAAVSAQPAKPLGTVFYPASSVRTPQPLLAALSEGAKAFTNVAVFVPAVPLQPPTPSAPMPAPYFIETPPSIACVYGQVPQTAKCNPNATKTNPSGGSRTIAIVDAFDDPTVRSDLDAFSNRFALPKANFDLIFASGKRPGNDKGWEIEIALDVEWAHAMAPKAKILLVEATSSSYQDLRTALDTATDRLATQGGGEVSLSWGGAEFADQTTFNASFKRKPGITYFAATGDSPGVNYPSTSADVVAVGGTTINRDAAGSYAGQTPWQDAGAGPSAFVPRPDYQKGVVSDNWRGVADVSAIADPNTGGVWVYDSGNAQNTTNHGWLAVGGTSAATPIVASIANNSGRFATSSETELRYIYAHVKEFSDIKSGSCGPLGKFSAKAGWDYCTGAGTPNGHGGL